MATSMFVVRGLTQEQAEALSKQKWAVVNGDAVAVKGVNPRRARSYEAIKLVLEALAPLRSDTTRLTVKGEWTPSWATTAAQRERQETRTRGAYAKYDVTCDGCGKPIGTQTANALDLPDGDVGVYCGRCYDKAR